MYLPKHLLSSFFFLPVSKINKSILVKLLNTLKYLLKKNLLFQEFFKETLGKLHSSRVFQEKLRSSQEFFQGNFFFQELFNENFVL